MFTDIINQYSHIEQRINDTQLLLDPWPHMYITEVFTPDFYRTIQGFETLESLDYVHEYGRKEYTFNQYDPQYEELTSKMFKLLANKFSEFLVHKPTEDVPATANFWVDNSDLKINDIHTDLFYDTPIAISGQIYLPDDLTQKHLGTELYRYAGDDLEAETHQDEGLPYPHAVIDMDSNNFEMVRRVPFYPNCMMVTINTPDSWHRAPTIAVEDGERRSLMLRWKV